MLSIVALGLSALGLSPLALAALSPFAMAALGWLGNGLYFLRFLVQWWQSERAGVSVAPRTFWWLSLGGAMTLGSYAFLSGNAPLFLGYALTFMIYLRNVWITYRGDRAGRLGPLPSLIVALIAGGALVVIGALPRENETLPVTWTALAFAGQAVFSMRFVVQWWATERSGRAHFPRSFWWLSLVGNVALLAYSIRLGDPIFIAGFALGPFVQIRNLMLPEDDVDGTPAAEGA